MNPLESLGLEDISLPPTPGFWPPAPGWWLLTCTLLGLGLAAMLMLRRRRRRRHLRQAAQILERLRTRHGNGTADLAELRALSAWLRQVCVRHYGSSTVAGLTGADWLAWLDRPLGGREFRDPPGQILAEGPYRRHLQTTDLDALYALCRRWLGALQRESR